MMNFPPFVQTGTMAVQEKRCQAKTSIGNSIYAETSNHEQRGADVINFVTEAPLWRAR